MALYFAHLFTYGITGRTIKAQLRKWSNTESSTLGEYWNQGAGTPAWQAGDPGDSGRLTFAEVAATGVYTYGAPSAFSTYTGVVAAYYFDSVVSSTLAVGSSWHYFVNGRIKDVDVAVATNDTDWADGGRLDTLLDTAAAGGVAVSVSPYVVAPSRTFVIEDDSDRARNIVTTHEGGKLTVRFDFARLLNEGAGVLSIVSVTDETGGLTPSAQIVSQDRMACHATFSGFVEGGSSLITCIVNTTDGDKLTGKGLIRVRS